MDALFDALHTTLDGDTTLGNLVSGIRFFRRPENPSQLVKPVLIYNLAPGIDEQGLHGAASNIAIEFDVWGYQHDNYDMAPDCVRTAQRVHEIMVSHKLNLSRGGHVRWGADSTFQQISQNDPDVVLLRGMYGTRYWSGGTIDELIAQS